MDDLTFTRYTRIDGITDVEEIMFSDGPGGSVDVMTSAYTDSAVDWDYGHAQTFTLTANEAHKLARWLLT